MFVKNMNFLAVVAPPYFYHIVTHEIFRVGFILAALYGLDTSADNIGNNYLNAPCRGNLCTISGAKFGDYKLIVMLIVRSLYGLKISGAVWRALFAKTLQDIDYSKVINPGILLEPNI